MKKKIIKLKSQITAIILCGGKGNRLRPITKFIPKPLVKIKNKEILFYIIKHLFFYNIKDCILAGGYKSNLLQKYAKNKKVSVINTGLNADIIQRIKKIIPYCKNMVLVCYGDTLLDIDLNRYLKFFLKDKEKISIASYNLKTNFGILNINNNNQVTSFIEKPKSDNWINVGYLLLQKKDLILLTKFKTFKKALEYLGCNQKLRAFKHDGMHITINSVSDLEEAKKNIHFFNKYE